MKPMTNQRFEALSRMCLNNWHYIRHKTLSFHEGINFFTGHSGSGKSTVIDAMQIVLYANTDGRGFFNKAAADDSDRSLIEYLRGMINIGEDNSFSYLRNRNFSSTIVLEFRQTDTGACQCVGVVFDVDTATNEISRLFFWHKGEIPDHEYRVSEGRTGAQTGENAGRPMSTDELKAWLLQNFSKEEMYFGSHNERFRKQLYDIYLGGLDAEKFPLLFKRAIPFRMNIKLEDFVREYICMEQDIHIEDMQLSVMEYGRMRKKIDDTCREIESLRSICGQHQLMASAREECRSYTYFADKFDIFHDRRLVAESQDKIQAAIDSRKRCQQEADRLAEEIDEISGRCDELLRRISMTGYEQLKGQLSALNQLVEQLSAGKARWEQTAARLKAWEEEDIVPNRTLWDIDAFAEGKITEEELSRLRSDLKEMKNDVERQQQDARGELRQLEKRRREVEEEMSQLRQGSKAYPRELEQARTILQNRLYQKVGKSVQVDILADLLDIRDDSWRSAVEGYLGGNKLSLVVEPRYAKAAMEIYRELDKEKYYQVAVLDTERVLADEHPVMKGSLSEEVETGRDYIRAYIDFQLGKVIKCETIDELRSCRIGITRDCVLYHSYRIQHINPANYTTRAYIGKHSLRQRIRLLEKELQKIESDQKPQQEILEEAKRVLGREFLEQEPSVYLEWKQAMEHLRQRMKEQQELKEKLEQLKNENVDQWEAERRALLDLCEQRKLVQREQQRLADRYEQEEKAERDNLTALNEVLIGKEKAFKTDPELENRFAQILEEKRRNVRTADSGRKTAGAFGVQSDSGSTADAASLPGAGESPYLQENSKAGESPHLQKALKSEEGSYPREDSKAGEGPRPQTDPNPQEDLNSEFAPLRFDRLRDQYREAAERARQRQQQEMTTLVNLRTAYLRSYPNRSFSPTSEDNREYQELLDSLNFDKLEDYRARAREQAQTAVEHFKDDFMYKIRSAIREAMQRKDELNRIISRLDFGKDKYQFYIGKNKGPDGDYYDMFMDDSLEINPADLDAGWENQLNMFTMQHENHYGAMINELINIFIPPENATAEERDAARRNMDKYADYRTYLSFDMQQLVRDEDETIRIQLSRMIKKNSGGEGQNPLYVALLASFAQAYRIDLKPGLVRSPTIRLVVLDEAFSKMDAEKVASCIQLIRGLGFQALISATNDKIQNYLETVDKIFVFANPNKKSISIQEFERREFGRLKQGIDEE